MILLVQGRPLGDEGGSGQSDTAVYPDADKSLLVILVMVIGPSGVQFRE